ncbi:MAG: hypothetical protein ACHQT6_09490 [Candidatus Acidiferrales bacterium]
MMHAVGKTLDRRFFLGVAVVCFTVALSAQAQEWNSYSNASDGFRASFPSAPEPQKRNVPTDAGTFELRSYVAQVAPYAFFIGVCDYGAQTNGSDPDTLLQGAKHGALTNSNSHLVSESKLTLGIYHGIQFEAESDTAHFSARIYMVGDTLYQTLVVSPVGKIHPDTARFLDSFQLIPRVRN